MLLNEGDMRSQPGQRGQSKSKCRSAEWLRGPKGPAGKSLVFAFQLTLAPAAVPSSRFFRNVWWVKKCVRELSRLLRIRTCADISENLPLCSPIHPSVCLLSSYSQIVLDSEIWASEPVGKATATFPMPREKGLRPPRRQGWSMPVRSNGRRKVGCWVGSFQKGHGSRRSVIFGGFFGIGIMLPTSLLKSRASSAGVTRSMNDDI